MKPTSIIVFLLAITVFPGCNSRESQSLEQEVLPYFSLIQTLESANNQLSRRLIDDQHFIQYQIYRQVSGGNKKYEWLPDEAQKITDKWREELAFLNSKLDQLAEIAEENPKGTYDNPFESNLTQSMMMGSNSSANDGSGNGEAYKIRRRMEAYNNWLVAWVEENIELEQKYIIDDLTPIITAPDKNNYISARLSNLTWEALHFQNGTAITSMGKLVELKYKVIQNADVLYRVMKSMVPEW